MTIRIPRGLAFPSDPARLARRQGKVRVSHMIAECGQFSSLTPHMLVTERWFQSVHRADEVGGTGSGITA